MKVLFLTHNLRQDNGAGVFSHRLIEGLKKELDIEPVVFTSEEYPKLWREIFKIRREIKKCDIVHALDGYPYGAVAYIASFGLRKKIIITAVGSGAIIYLYKPIYSFFVKRAYRAADKVIAISRFTKDEILKKMPNLAISVINHGVDYEKFQENGLARANESFHFSRSPSVRAQGTTQSRPAALSAQGGTVPAPRAKPVQRLVGSAQPYILGVGSLRWRKGYHRSIEAFAKVANVFPDLNYVIVGKKYDEAYYNRLKLEIRDLKLEGRVIILDNIDREEELIQLYKNAELFCLMAQTAHRDLEGFGLVFLEAAAAGLPVVGTKGSGVEDAVLDGKNGVLLDDPRDVNGCAEAVIKILKNKNLAPEMSKESLELARNSRWESKIAEYVSIYNNLNKPKIVYVTNARLPTEKAHGLATVKIAEAFADLGYSVEMIIPARWRKSEDIFKYYGLHRNFNIKRLSTIDLLTVSNPPPTPSLTLREGDKKVFNFLVGGGFQKLAFLIQLFSFSIFAAIYCTWRFNRQVVFFSHDHVPLWFLSWFGARIFYDIHHFPDHNIFYERVLKKSFGLAVQTKWKIEALWKEFGVPKDKIVYWPNGTDVQKFQIRSTKSEARNKLGLPQDKKIIVYTGQLFDWKGADTMIGAAKLLRDIDFCIVGGGNSPPRPPSLTLREGGERREEVSSLGGELPYSNIHFTGQRPHDEIPLWLRAADVLVLPNTGRQKVSLYYTSPMKMFEYMASGTPIVASDIPSIREILNDKNSFLAEADNPKSFAEKINYALEHSESAQKLAIEAQKDVQKYTWLERAKRISERFI